MTHSFIKNVTFVPQGHKSSDMDEMRLHFQKIISNAEACLDDVNGNEKPNSAYLNAIEREARIIKSLIWLIVTGGKFRSLAA